MSFKRVSTTDDISEMLAAYYQTEHQLIELNRIISVDNKPETFSPRLYNILGDSCNQVENMLRLICDQLGLDYPKNNAHFPDFYEKLNQTGIMRIQTIDLLIGPRSSEGFTTLSEIFIPYTNPIANAGANIMFIKIGDS